MGIKKSNILVESVESGLEVANKIFESEEQHNLEIASRDMFA